MNINLIYDTWDNKKKQPLKPNCNEIYNNDNDDYLLKDLFGYNIKKFKLSDVEKHPNENFHYFIPLSTKNIVFNYLKNKPILPKKIINYCKKNNNIKIIFFNTDQTESVDVLSTLNFWTIDQKLNQEQFWLIGNEEKLLFYKSILKTDINIYTTNRIANLIENTFKNKKNNLNIEKNFLFECHNEEPKAYILFILSNIKKYNILSDTNWSLSKKYDFIDNYYLTEIFNFNDIKNISNEIDFFNDTKNIIFEKKVYDTQLKKINSYFNIIIEDGLDYNYITKKSIIPFLDMQFPLILSFPNYIKKIKKIYNLDLFDDIIDYSYDSEKDYRLRYIKFFKEIKRIYDNKNFFINFYKNNKNRFIKNLEIINEHKINSNNKILMEELIFKKIKNPKGIMFIDNDVPPKNPNDIIELYLESNNYKKIISSNLKTFYISLNEHIDYFKNFDKNILLDYYKVIPLKNVEYLIINVPESKNFNYNYSYNNKNYSFIINDKNSKKNFYEWILEYEKITLKKWHKEYFLPQIISKIKDIILYHKNKNVKCIIISKTKEISNLIINDNEINNTFLPLLYNNVLYNCIDDLMIDNIYLLNNIISNSILNKIKKDKKDKLI